MSEEEEQRRIAEARVKTGDFIARLMMAYAGFAAFCVFTLLSPDRLMIEAKASLNMPFAGAVSFLAFMLVAPVVLIGMRVYLEVYVQHWRQLAAELDTETEPKTLSPLKHPLLRIFSALVLYLLLPAMLVLFTWKAAAKDVWGEVFLLLTVVCAAAQVYQFVRWRWSRRAAQVAAVSGSLFVIVLVGVRYEWRLPHRGLDLARADLSGAYLHRQDLRGADLTDANLANANLTAARLKDANLMSVDLTGANLYDAELVLAQLTGADLTGADLLGAELVGADLQLSKLKNTNLTGADLRSANLGAADFTGANLSDADLRYTNVTQEQLDSACVRSDGKPQALPEGLSPPQKVCVLRTQ